MPQPRETMDARAERAVQAACSHGHCPFRTIMTYRWNTSWGADCKGEGKDKSSGMVNLKL